MSNGDSIEIFNDPWLPRPHSFRPITRLTLDHRRWKVSSLIDPDLEQWNIALVSELFWPVDHEAVFGVPVGMFRGKISGCGTMMKREHTQ